MPKSTQIIKWRTRRQRQRQRGGLHMARWVSVLILGLTTAVFTFILLGVLGITAVFTSFNRDLPSFTELENLGQDNTVPFETSKIYAWGNPNANGQRDPILIYEIIDPLDGEHQWLPLDQIPQQFIDATIASEDPTFWSSQNIDLIDIGRTFNQYMLQGGNIQGRSSIIQQVVKNNLIEIETLDGGAENGLNDYQRLLQEMLLARQVSQSYSKEQILEWHLNTNFYGNLAYGIESAARIYFDKPAAELSLAEVAMLAAISQSPNWNPINNPEAAKVQQELVLDGMVREGMIRAETAVSTKQLPVPIINPIADRYEIIAPHFALFVQAQLEEMFDPEQLLGGGLRVYTSLDLSYQQQAECVTRAHVNRLSGIIGPGLPADGQSSCAALDFLPSFDQADAGIDHEVSNAAVLMLDSETSEIKAMVGSLNYWNPAIDGSFNMAVDGLRQPGSAFIPFIYLTALSQGYSAASMVLDVETDFSNANSGIPYVPQNDDRQFHGPMRLRQALGNSYNIPAVQVMSWVGINKVLRTAHNLGINSLDQGNSSYGLDLTLNGGEVSLLDMTYAFSVMDNMGVMIGQPRPTDQTQPGYRTLDPVAILRVEDRNGNVLYEYDQPQQREILTPQLAYIMNDMLSDRSTRCAALGCPNLLELPDNRPAAAKIGTTNDFRDGWTVGYTPQLVTGVWVGNSDNSPMQNVSGSTGAAPIWHALMSWALRDEPLDNWLRPSGIVQQPVCNLSGLLPTSSCPTISEIFIDGTQPTIFDNMYQEFAINRETGRLATIYTPPELVDRELFVIYPEAAADWVRDNKIPQPPDEYDTINAPDQQNNNIRITSPIPFAYVQGQLLITGTVRSDNFSFYRLAYFAGLTPNNLQTLADNVTEPRENEELVLWDVSELEGLYTLLLTVVREDGGFEEYSVQVTVDNRPPTVELLSPLPNQQIFTDEEWVTVQARAEDDLLLDRVEFYVDGAERPFAVSTTPPFTQRWAISGPGCNNFQVIAVDAAGNESGGETAVSACLIER